MFNDNSGITTKLISRIKGGEWRDELHCWHIPYYDNYKEFLNRKYRGTLQFEHLHMKVEQNVFNSSDKNEATDNQTKSCNIAPNVVLAQLKPKD